MTERRDPMPTGWERIVRKAADELRRVLKEAGKAERGEPSPLSPAKNWSVIWVLSGPEFSFEETDMKNGKENQTLNRFLKGVELVRKVTALKTKKAESAVTLNDIRHHGPTMYFNGRTQHNQALRQLLESGLLEDMKGPFRIPRDSILITDSEQIMNTGDQVDAFPRKLVPKKGHTLAVVTSVPHIVRVHWTLRRESSPFRNCLDRIVFIPEHTKRAWKADVRREFQKLPEYAARGLILPP